MLDLYFPDLEYRNIFGWIGTERVNLIIDLLVDKSYLPELSPRGLVDKTFEG